MKRMTLPAILVAAVLAFSLAGCSQAQSVNEDTLKGTWALESGSDLGFEAYLDFEDDNVAEMLLADSWLSGTWEVSGTGATISFDGYDLEGNEKQDVAKLTYANNKLTVGSGDGSKLVFVKDDSEETTALFEGGLTFGDDEVALGDDAITLGDGDGAIDESEYVEPVIDGIEPVSVADDDKFTISVTGKGTDFTADPGYQLSVTNKTDKSVYLMAEDEFTVGDKKVEPGIGEEVEAGATVDVFMYFPQDELGGGLEALTSANGTIQVLDYDSDEVLGTYTFHMEG